jgi:hypothetical protein
MSHDEESPEERGEFSVAENLYGTEGINGNWMNSLLPHDAQKKRAGDGQTQRRALCCSIMAMALSIPALIGA